jgi:predicted GIY-YIG superfamily endonuclease
MAYTESFVTKELAYVREREVKAWKSRIRIEKLIAGSEHPAYKAGCSEVLPIPIGINSHKKASRI